MLSRSNSHQKEGSKSFPFHIEGGVEIEKQGQCPGTSRRTLCCPRTHSGATRRLLDEETISLRLDWRLYKL